MVAADEVDIGTCYRTGVHGEEAAVLVVCHTLAPHSSTDVSMSGGRNKKSMYFGVTFGLCIPKHTAQLVDFAADAAQSANCAVLYSVQAFRFKAGGIPPRRMGWS